MLREAKTVTIGFRCTPDFKKQMTEIAYSQKMEPSEYMHEVIERDIKMKLSEPSETEKTFIDKSFDKYTDRILTFISVNVDKRLAFLESKLLTKEERTRQIITGLLTFAESSKIDVSEESKKNWIKRISESTDLDKDIADIKKYVTDTVKKYDEEEKAKKQPK